MGKALVEAIANPREKGRRNVIEVGDDACSTLSKVIGPVTSGALGLRFSTLNRQSSPNHPS